jgi:pantoate--beta-alanine ligase
MGYLHDGHLSLMHAAKRVSDVVVISIFVNPTQFGPNEDFSRYPRDLERDTALAASAGVDIIFYPSAEEMYPSGFSTYVEVEGLSSKFEGKFRPTHFRGVTTVVLKLLNIVRPMRSFFGQKDAQQCAVIKKMVRDLNLSTEIVTVPTTREPDGLAMSSRNTYLNSDERMNAPILFRSLQYAKEILLTGTMEIDAIKIHMQEMILSGGASQIDYIEILDAETFSEIQHTEEGQTVLVALAVRFGRTRLIDNIVIHRTSPT